MYFQKGFLFGVCHAFFIKQQTNKNRNQCCLRVVVFVRAYVDDVFDNSATSVACNSASYQLITTRWQ